MGATSLGRSWHEPRRAGTPVMHAQDSRLEISLLILSLALYCPFLTFAGTIEEVQPRVQLEEEEEEALLLLLQMLLLQIDANFVKKRERMICCPHC